MNFPEHLRRAVRTRGHAAVEAWIANTDDFAIEVWHATELLPNKQGARLTVEYRYRKDSQRWIHTERKFHVAGHEVAPMPMDE